MRVVAVVDLPKVMEKILRQLNLWWGPATFASARPPPGLPQSNTNGVSAPEELCESFDPEGPEGCLHGSDPKPPNLQSG